MTVDTTAFSSSFTGNGVQQDFLCAFPFMQTSDIEVTLDDELQVLNRDYTLMGLNENTLQYIEEGFVVRFTQPPASDVAVYIRRRTPRTNPYNLSRGDRFRLRFFERMYDRLILIFQEIGQLILEGFQGSVSDPNPLGSWTPPSTSGFLLAQIVSSDGAGSYGLRAMTPLGTGWSVGGLPDLATDAAEVNGRTDLSPGDYALALPLENSAGEVAWRFYASQPCADVTPTPTDTTRGWVMMDVTTSGMSNMKFAHQTTGVLSDIELDMDNTKAATGLTFSSLHSSGKWLVREDFNNDQVLLMDMDDDSESIFSVELASGGYSYSQSGSTRPILTVDDSGNVYVRKRSTGGGGSYTSVEKYNSSGTKQWETTQLGFGTTGDDEMKYLSNHVTLTGGDEVIGIGRRMLSAPSTYTERGIEIIDASDGSRYAFVDTAFDPEAWLSGVWLSEESSVLYVYCLLNASTGTTFEHVYKIRASDSVVIWDYGMNGNADNAALSGGYFYIAKNLSITHDGQTTPSYMIRLDASDGSLDVEYGNPFSGDVDYLDITKDGSAVLLYDTGGARGGALNPATGAVLFGGSLWMDDYDDPSDSFVPTTMFARNTAR